jgi:hypothetical protein
MRDFVSAVSFAPIMVVSQLILLRTSNPAPRKAWSLARVRLMVREETEDRRSQMASSDDKRFIQNRLVVLRYGAVHPLLSQKYFLSTNRRRPLDSSQQHLLSLRLVRLT